MSFRVDIEMLTGPSDAVRFIMKTDLSASIDLKVSRKAIL